MKFAGNFMPSGDSMVAISYPYPDVRKLQAVERSTPPTPFQPLDPAILNASIPTFFVGRNRDGLWVARDAKGEHGGIFLLKHSALAFARAHSRPLACATIFSSESFELDVDNEGNPFVSVLVPLLRGMMSLRRRATRLICNIAAKVS